MKRFYKLVSLKSESGAHVVCLDGKPVKTQARNTLASPCKAVAEEMQREWAAQKETILPDTMPITQIVSTKIDRVRAERAAMAQTVLRYVNTDLLCYRTDHPAALGQAQAACWDPWLEWLAQRHGVEMETTTGLRALMQPEKTHAEIVRLVGAMDEDRFTVFQMAASLGGSIVLALAFMEGTISAEDLFRAARVEESYKAAIYDEEKYGPDPMQGRKDAAILRDLQACERYLALIS